MKPHITQTVADLKAEREKLDWMISTLERYGGNDGASTPTESPAIVFNQKSAPEPEKPKRTYKRRKLIPEIVQPAEKPKRGRKHQTPVEAECNVAAILSDPTTFAGAMKQYVLDNKRFTSEQCWSVLSGKFPELTTDKSVNNVYANFSYWASKDHLRKIEGDGQTAVFEVIDRPWFKPTED